MITVNVNNKDVQAEPGEMLLTTLQRAGVTVPTLCHMEDLFPSGACRMCVVEVEGRPGLVPSCAFPVTEGLVVKTHSPRVLRARKTIVELLLASHQDDCLYCVRSGDCRLQDLAIELGVRERRFTGAKNAYDMDVSSPSIIRDPEKCILCGRCVRVCEEVQGVAAIDFIGRGSATRIATAFDGGLNTSSCINCGQCIMVCPTGALREQSAWKEVFAAINDPAKTVVVQHAPAVSVTLAEELGIKPGTDIAAMMTAALRQLGFDRVFETSFAADLTIMEEATELVERIKNGGPLPMMTSCSPGWIKFVEQFYPEFLPNISSCKSPQQMMGAVIKTYFAEREGIDPANIYSVSIMPCVAKKFEAGRDGMGRAGLFDVDAVVTTRELARMIRGRGIDVNALTGALADDPFGERSTAGKLFGATGGVMEAAIRTAHYLITGREMEHLEVKAVRGMEAVKEAHLDIDGMQIGVAVVNGLGNVRTILDEIAAGRDDLHFIEVMTCPGGCIAGGGQPLGADLDEVRSRMRALYSIDRSEHQRISHGNTSVRRLYDEYLEKPGSHKAHKLLHTSYKKRDDVAL